MSVSIPILPFHIKALVHTNPSRASFLGCLTVIMCPLLEAVFDQRNISICNAPCLWLSAVLSLSGVALLELYDSSDEIEEVTSPNKALGDGLAVISAFGMSACFYTTEKMLNNSTGQVLPITAGQVGVSAFISTIWCMVDRWASDTWTGSYELPASLFQQSNLPATLSILWTGLVATDLNVGDYGIRNSIKPRSSGYTLNRATLGSIIFISTLERKLQCKRFDWGISSNCCMLCFSTGKCK